MIKLVLTEAKYLHIRLKQRVFSVHLVNTILEPVLALNKAQEYKTPLHLSEPFQNNWSDSSLSVTAFTSWSGSHLETSAVHVHYWPKHPLRQQGVIKKHIHIINTEIISTPPRVINMFWIKATCLVILLWQKSLQKSISIFSAWVDDYLRTQGLSPSYILPTWATVGDRKLGQSGSPLLILGLG